MVALGLIIATLGRIYYDSYKERKKIEALNEKIKVYNQSINAYDEGVLILSQNNDVLFVNKEFGDFFGKSEKEITPDFLRSLKIAQIDNPNKLFDFLDIIDRRKYITDVRLPGNHHPVPVKITSNLFRGDDDATYWRIVVIHDQSEYYRLQKQIQKTHSYNDLLTDLPMHGQLVGDLIDANIRSNINDTTMMLAFFGIRNFPSRRLVLGYEKTNQMIKTIAQSLKKHRHDDEKLYYRGQGDFALFLDASHDPKQEIERVQSLLSDVREDLGEQGFDVDFSVAILHLRRDRRTPDAIIDRCHELQIEAERLGKTVTEETLSVEDVEGTLHLDYVGKRHNFTKSDFTNAIQRKEFFSFYQPIFSLKDDRLIGAEYLMRWNHPKYGLLNASEFLDKAVQLNVLTEITDYLIENVLSHKASWDAFGIEDFGLSINFAMPELRVANFAEKLEQKIHEHAIDPETITIDLSERLLSEGIDLLQTEMEILKRIGVRIAMDSFGEGFTHLRFLEELHFDTIKIDQSLIRGIEKNPDKRKLVSAIVAMGKGLEVSVGATYIDTQAAHDVLRDIGCDYGQGYFYSKALPFFEMLNFIQEYRGIKPIPQSQAGAR
jgi:EAL domain-containing protein (putative c-di-GMP-specific phosphodiesterase class I)/GGDEF domain-containing protein